MEQHLKRRKATKPWRTLSWAPCSMILPLNTTAMLSASRTVLSLRGGSKGDQLGRDAGCRRNMQKEPMGQQQLTLAEPTQIRH